MSHGTTVRNICMHTLCCLCLHVWCQARYSLQCCQALVHSQSISQGSGSRISNCIPFKTVVQSTPELVYTPRGCNVKCITSSHTTKSSMLEPVVE